MTTIDHAAEARKALEKYPRGELTSEGDAIAVAQVHATLAVAEQLRVTNWIAYLSQNDKIPAAHSEWNEAALSEEDV